MFFSFITNCLKRSSIFWLVKSIEYKQIILFLKIRRMIAHSLLPSEDIPAALHRLVEEFPAEAEEVGSMV